MAQDLKTKKSRRRNLRSRHHRQRMSTTLLPALSDSRSPRWPSSLSSTKMATPSKLRSTSQTLMTFHLRTGVSCQSPSKRINRSGSSTISRRKRSVPTSLTSSATCAIGLSISTRKTLTTGWKRRPQPSSKTLSTCLTTPSTQMPRRQRSPYSTSGPNTESRPQKKWMVSSPIHQET